MNIGNIIKALQAGYSLKDPKKWKNRQALGTSVSAILLVLFNWLLPDTTIDAELMQNINNAVVSLMIAANLYLTGATSEKVGF